MLLIVNTMTPQKYKLKSTGGKMKKLVLSAAVAVAAIANGAVHAAPTNEELWKLVQEQKKEIEELKKDQAETDKKVEATADALDSGVSNKASEWAEKTKIGGYAEHHYNNFTQRDDQIDAHRFVLFVSHEYSDKVRFFSELELEHSLAGDGKPGEVELEQAYIEWAFAEKHSLVSGLFLIPVGILNETHEPETFYGTERNRVESRIIPTTWWETGLLVRGEIAPGLSYDVAVHSGLENTEANIRSGRQKSAEAVANDFAYTARVKYTGVPGLELASTVQYQEDISQGEFDDASATLIEAHGIYSSGAFSLRALYASWNVAGDEAELLGRDSQEGFYIEPSYKVLENLGFFARYSEYNNQAGLASSEEAEFWDYGLNYWLHPQVIFKIDMSDDRSDSDNDSLNLGVGWSF